MTLLFMLLLQVQEPKSLNDIHFDLNNILVSNGIMISIISYVVVFFALTLLYVIIRYVTRYLLNKQIRFLKSTGHNSSTKEEDLDISSEINAAIAVALALHLDQSHDIESTVLTLKKVQRTYSPWSSKLYSITKFPDRK